MEKRIILKPHHFLDIFKLYGLGLRTFLPDKKYCHDFYKIGNIILSNPLVIVHLTIGFDDVCKPCRFLKKGRCVDKMPNFIYPSKQKWNEIIDRRILGKLDLKENVKMTAIDLCKLAQETLSINDIANIWQERPKGETKKRIKYLLVGLKKYSEDYSGNS